MTDWRFGRWRADPALAHGFFGFAAAGLVIALKYLSTISVYCSIPASP